jgi:hypothetical protein
MAEHAKGPWCVSRSLNGTRIYDAKDRCIAEVLLPDLRANEDEAIANANLIAAAPLLLTACEAILRAHNQSREYIEDGLLVRHLEEAIAKARSE